MNVKRGVVYTRRWVADLALDLAGYVPGTGITAKVILEPACGTGAFLLPIVERLAAERAQLGLAWERLARAVLACDIDEKALAVASSALTDILCRQQCPHTLAAQLVAGWLHCEDALVRPLPPCDVVVGNPPYVRARDMDRAKRELYCRSLPSMTRGCDLYVAFFDKGLDVLRPGGVLCYLCADRWLQNAYGRRLRQRLAAPSASSPSRCGAPSTSPCDAPSASSHGSSSAPVFSLETLVRMHEVNAFAEDGRGRTVDAYPALTLIRALDHADPATPADHAGNSAPAAPAAHKTCREQTVRFARCRPDFGPGDAPQLLAWHKACLQEHQEGVHACPASHNQSVCYRPHSQQGGHGHHNQLESYGRHSQQGCHRRHNQHGTQGLQAQHERFDAFVLPKPAGSSVYALGDAACVDFVTAARKALPALEDTGVQLGTGLATGCDAVFITENDDLVEAERLLPLFDMRNFRQGKVVRRRWLVNPWNADGSLVCLADYPRLRAYLEAHAHVLRKRALVRGSQGHGEGRTKTWYRTIDKPVPGLLDRELLLMPDMATTSDPVLSCGFYPGHTTCWLASDVWDMRVLGAFLLAETTQRFISVLGVAMRGGTLRFQAQYLRLVHLPAQEQVHPELQHSLAQAFITRDREAATRCAERAYADALQGLDTQAAQAAQDESDAPDA